MWALPASAAYLLFPDGNEKTLAGGMKSAYEAYKKGDFAAAVPVFRAEAAKGDKDAQFAMGRIYEEGRTVEASAAAAESWYGKAAAQNHVGAQFYLAALLLATPGRTAEGMEWLRKAADGKSPRALLSLGSMALTGTGMEKNVEEARVLLEQASGLGESEATDLLGLMYSAGEGVGKDGKKAVQLFEEAAGKGHIKSILRLAVMYLNGAGVEKSGEKAREWFVKAADLKSTEALLALGVMYESGNGVAKKPEEAVEWYRKAAEAGDAGALAKLGALYAEGTGVAKDEKAAMEWFEKAAKKGSGAAMHAIAGFYEKGRAVKVDAEESLRWLIRAATANFPVAMRELGNRYRGGTGVNKDTIVAQSWLTRAASNGDAESALTVAEMLISGEGGLPSDPKNAKAILTRAAELGITEAQLRLAEYHEKGLDGRPDLIRAYALTLAVGDKYEPGKAKREALEKVMTKEQVELGKKEFERIRATPAGAPLDAAAPTVPDGVKPAVPAAAGPGASVKP
jgi:TPR repeat protein